MDQPGKVANPTRGQLNRKMGRWPEAYLVTLTDRCSFLCVSGRCGTIAKSMHEEHLCVVALTSMERGTQFFPLASYRLV